MLNWLQLCEYVIVLYTERQRGGEKERRREGKKEKNRRKEGDIERSKGEGRRDLEKEIKTDEGKEKSGDGFNTMAESEMVVVIVSTMN